MEGNRFFAEIVSEQVTKVADSYVDNDPDIAAKRSEFYESADGIEQSLRKSGGHEEDIKEIRSMTDCCCELNVMVIDAVCRMLTDQDAVKEILTGLKEKINKEQYAYLKELFWCYWAVQPGERKAECDRLLNNK